MPYADPERRRQYEKEYAAANREQLREYNKKYYANTANSSLNTSG